MDCGTLTLQRGQSRTDRYEATIVTWESDQDRFFTIYFEGVHAEEGSFRGSCQLERERGWHFRGEGRFEVPDEEPCRSAIEAQLQLVGGLGGTKVLTGTWLDQDDDTPYTLRVEIADR